MYYSNLEADVINENYDNIDTSINNMMSLYEKDGQLYQRTTSEQLSAAKYYADQRIKEAQRQGKTVTDEEKKAIYASYNNLVKKFTDELGLITTEQRKQLEEYKKAGDAQIAEYERQGIEVTDEMRDSAYEQYNILKQNLADQVGEVKDATPEQQAAWQWLMDNDAETFKSVLDTFAGDDNTILGNALSTMSSQLDSDTKVETSSRGLADRQYKAMNKVGDYDDLGSDTGDAYKKGLDSQKQNVAWVADQIANETKRVNANSGSMWGWGYDMINGLASGISDASWRITSKVQSIAKSIWENLHFSRPEKGLLRDYETWMPDMVKGLAKSMVDATPILENATTKLAAGISDELQNMYINPEDYKLRTETDINQIVETKVTIDSNLPELFYNAIVNGMNDSSVQVNVQARTDKGVIFEVVQEEANNFYNSTGEAPFPVM